MSIPLYIKEIDAHVYSFLDPTIFFIHRAINHYLLNVWEEVLIEKILIMLPQLVITEVIRSRLYEFYKVLKYNLTRSTCWVNWAVDHHDWVLTHNLVLNHHKFPNPSKFIEASFDGRGQLFEILDKYLNTIIPSQHPSLLKYYRRFIITPNSASLCATLSYRRGYLNIAAFWSKLSVYPIKYLDTQKYEDLREDIWKFII